jgi:hypothetical protein
MTVASTTKTKDPDNAECHTFIKRQVDPAAETRNQTEVGVE